MNLTNEETITCPACNKSITNKECDMSSEKTKKDSTITFHCPHCKCQIECKKLKIEYKIKAKPENIKIIIDC